jgi:TetR/AcrR family transcriptional repressor of nem operon
MIAHQLMMTIESPIVPRIGTMTAKAEQKQESHEAILASAAALLRKQGIRASSVMDVMKGAGLTVGGFYSHFDSKEHLFAETIRGAGTTMWRGLLKRALSVMRRYLSRSHRDNPEEGCILPSSASEVARDGEPYRGALEEGLGGFVSSFAEMLGTGPENREKAVALVALMYGALSLSRALSDTPLSSEFLRAARALGEQSLPADAEESRS